MPAQVDPEICRIEPIEPSSPGPAVVAVGAEFYAEEPQPSVAPSDDDEEALLTGRFSLDVIDNWRSFRPAPAVAEHDMAKPMRRGLKCMSTCPDPSACNPTANAAEHCLVTWKTEIKPAAPPSSPP